MSKRPMRCLAAVFCALAVGVAGSCHTPPFDNETPQLLHRAIRNPPSEAAALGCFNS